MPKNKKPFITPVYIDIIKDRLPLLTEQNQWWKAQPIETAWEIPMKIQLAPQKNDEEHFQDSAAGKKSRKLKLKFEQQMLKKSIQEDEEAVEKLDKVEEHLEEDIDKAKKKLEKTK